MTGGKSNEMLWNVLMSTEANSCIRRTSSSCKLLCIVSREESELLFLSRTNSTHFVASYAAKNVKKMSIKVISTQLPVAYQLLQTMHITILWRRRYHLTVQLYSQQCVVKRLQRMPASQVEIHRAH